MLANPKIYSKATVIMTVWYGQRNKIDRWSRTTSPEIGPYMYSQLIFDKGAQAIQWRKIVSSTNGARTTRQPQVKKEEEEESKQGPYTPLRN